MGWWRAWALALLLVGCGLSKSDRRSGSSDVGDSAPPLDERPSELQRWVLLASPHSSTIVEFNRLLAPRSITLATGNNLGRAAISNEATKIAYPVRQDSWVVELVEPVDFTTPIGQWYELASPPILSWIGEERVLVTTEYDGTSAFGLLEQSSPPTISSVGVGVVVGRSTNAVVLHSDDRFIHVGAAGPILQFKTPDAAVVVGVSDDGTRLALASSDVLPPTTLPGDGVSVDTVRWVSSPPPSCPNPGSPGSCHPVPTEVNIDRVAYSPDKSEVWVESSSTEGAHLAGASISPPIEIRQGPGDTIARSYLGRQWGYLSDSRLYYATNAYSGQDSHDSDSHRLVVGGERGVETPGAAMEVTPSGDQQWMFVSVWFRDPQGGPGKHGVEATFLGSFPDAPPREIFTTSDIDLFVVPSPIGSELLVGSQNYDDGGFYCTTVPRTECDGITYYLISDEGSHGELVPDVQGPLWTPDGQGLVGERYGKLGYVPRDAPEQFYELAEGGHLTLRMPSRWQPAP